MVKMIILRQILIIRLGSFYQVENVDLTAEEVVVKILNKTVREK